MKAGFQYFPENFMWSQGNCLRCFRAGIKGRYPNIERVEVKYEGTTLPAWFMKAPVAGKAPTVCFFDGLDSTKELSVQFGGVELALRGIHTLAIDGPGQGEALRLQKIPSRQKTLKIFTAEEGGSEHCQGDNRFLGATYVADWLADHL